MKKSRNIIWGIVLLALGVVLALEAFGAEINVFFKGWWTLFMIVPGVIGLFTEREKTGNLCLLLIGVALLAGTRGWVSFDLLFKLLGPAVLILIGIRLIFKDVFGRKVKEAVQRVKAESGKLPEYAGTFSGQKVNYDGMVFDGVDLTAAFGGVECDLRGAIIQRDVVIHVNAVFGGIDIFLPPTVNVQVSTTAIFGGVGNKHVNQNVEGRPTVYVSGNALFGGVDIK